MFRFTFFNQSIQIKMKNILLAFMMISFWGMAQTKREIKREIRHFQKELNEEYTNTKTSPLRGENLTKFKKHPFFPINLDYRVVAQLEKTEHPEAFQIPTSSGKTKTYIEYGKASFQLFGKPYTLTLYQSVDLMKQEKYKEYLFLPFRDLTNGVDTYGGGKYMDLKIPQGTDLLLDFNQSYHPFCAYNAFDYNCPIVPEENRLPIRIEAGVKYKDVYFH